MSTRCARSEETKRKIGLANKGKVRSTEVRENLSEKMKIIVCGSSNPMFGKTHSIEARKKIRLARLGCQHNPNTIMKMKVNNIGERNPRWLGGISRLPYPFEFDKELRKSIFERDSFRCQLCEEDFDLMPHHIDYDKMNIDEDNLITLCRKCNSRVNTNREYWIEYFRNKLKQEKEECVLYRE